MFNWLKCLFKSSPEEMLIEKIRNSNTLKWIGRTVEMSTVPEPCYSFDGYFFIGVEKYKFSIHKTKVNRSENSIYSRYNVCIYHINNTLSPIYISDEDTKHVINFYNDGVNYFKELDMPLWEREKLKMKKKVEKMLNDLSFMKINITCLCK